MTSQYAYTFSIKLKNNLNATYVLFFLFRLIINSSISRIIHSGNENTNYIKQECTQDFSPGMGANKSDYILLQLVWFMVCTDEWAYTYMYMYYNSTIHCDITVQLCVIQQYRPMYDLAVAIKWMATSLNTLLKRALLKTILIVIKICRGVDCLYLIGQLLCV